MFTIDLRSYNAARLLGGCRPARTAVARNTWEEETQSTSECCSNVGDNRGFVSVLRVADSSSRKKLARARYLEIQRKPMRCRLVISGDHLTLTEVTLRPLFFANATTRFLVPSCGRKWEDEDDVWCHVILVSKYYDIFSPIDVNYIKLYVPRKIVWKNFEEFYRI